MPDGADAEVLSQDLDPGVLPVALRPVTEHGGGFVGSSSPSFSWGLEADRPAVRQLAYELQVAADDLFEDRLESSGAVRTSSPIAAPWPGAPLHSREVRWARVRLWTDGGVTAWSAPARLEAALLERDDWVARPISPLSNIDQSQPRPAPLLRRAFVIDGAVARARLYVTAQGVHESTLNGLPLDDALLEPGWTAYQSRLLYAAYDVTALVKTGDNVLAAAVGDGWWRGDLTWMERRAVYGATTTLLAQLEVTLTDGTTLVVGTDAQWRGACGEILEADLYNGCAKDLRLEPVGWRQTGFDDQGWEPVCSFDLPVGLQLREMPPVRIVDAWGVTPEPIGQGRYRIDTGQNLAGFLRLTVRGASGSRVSVRHAEVLDNDGRLYTAPLRNARACDRYVLADDAQAVLLPSFTFHGFRYAEIECDEGVAVDAVEVCAVSSDLQDAGTFRCSDPRLNKLFDNVRWSQRGNFLALPTDCPQRDERLGWTGDIQVFAPTACTNSDARSFLGSWLKDLGIEQRADGCVPSTAPNVITGHQFEYGGVGWGDAATLVPWALYEAYGDASILAEQFDSMQCWVDYGASRRGSDGLWRGDLQLGDWLDPGAPSDEPHKATTDGDYIANAYLSFSARVLARAAGVLGRTVEAARYEALADEVAAKTWSSWRDHAITTQAGCAMALQFGLVTETERARVAQALAEIVAANSYRIGTGFLGTPLVLPALAAGGHVETAYRLLLNEACPGWLYQVERGATTMWERWDAVLEDGSLHAGEMSTGESASMISFNHYAYGAVAAWLYRSVAGIAPCLDEPGYGCIEFAPLPGGGLTWAEAHLQTPYGQASISWRIGQDGELDVALTVPAGSWGRFRAPAGWRLAQADDLDPGAAIQSGQHRLRLEPTR